MKKLVSILFLLVFVVGFWEVASKIKRANFQYVLHERAGMKEIVKESSPELFSRTKKFMKDRLILKDGCVIIFGSGNIRKKLRIAVDILKKEKNVTEIDVSTPGYAVVKNGGKK